MSRLPVIRMIRHAIEWLADQPAVMFAIALVYASIWWYIR